MKISVVGLGYIGLPTSIILAKAGHKVMGFDVSEKVVKTLNSGKIHIKENNLQETYDQVLNTGNFKAFTELQIADVYIVAVPTPFKENENQKLANLDYIDVATELIAKILKPEDLVILESTSPPLTTKRMTNRLMEKSGLRRDQFYTAHCPERVLPGKILFELEHNDRIIGAERKIAAEKAKDVYQTFVKQGKIYLTDDVTAEMAKLVENSFRDVNIAFANELSVLCDQLSIDVNELISLANKHPRVNILTPGIGVGGHCISVDPWFIVEMFDEAQLIKQARITNDAKPYWVANKVEEKIGFDKNTTIGILGMAYKPNIDDLRESPSFILANTLIERGYTVIGCEPNVSEKIIKNIPLVSFDEILKDADVLVLAQKHQEFVDKMDILLKKNTLFF